MKRVMLLLATKKGYDVLIHLRNNYRQHIGAVVSFDEVGVKKNWCDDICSVCKNSGIPFYKWGDIKKCLESIIENNGITGVVCISWRYLVPTEINKFLQDDMVVFHDSLLPKYRGFAPVVTAMICGDTRIGATALYAADEVDAGDIICQRSFAITKDDYIVDVIDRMSDVYVEMAGYIMDGMLKQNLPRMKQDESNATYSIWRNEDDYWIDWNDASERIAMFIRATGYPYKGALTSDGSSKLRITRCTVMENDIDFPLRNPGKLWSIKDNKPVVVCGSGLLRIEEAYGEDGGLYEFKKLRIKFGGGYFCTEENIGRGFPLGLCA